MERILELQQIAALLKQMTVNNLKWTSISFSNGAFFPSMAVQIKKYLQPKVIAVHILSKSDHRTLFWGVKDIFSELLMGRGGRKVNCIKNSFSHKCLQRPYHYWEGTSFFFIWGAQDLFPDPFLLAKSIQIQFDVAGGEQVPPETTSWYFNNFSFIQFLP